MRILGPLLIAMLAMIHTPSWYMQKLAAHNQGFQCDVWAKLHSLLALQHTLDAAADARWLYDATCALSMHGMLISARCTSFRGDKYA